MSKINMSKIQELADADMRVNGWPEEDIIIINRIADYIALVLTQHFKHIMLGKHFIEALRQIANGMEIVIREYEDSEK